MIKLVINKAFLERKDQMRKVPPILKPIALLTLSILIATTSGILNNSSYRQVKATTPKTESSTSTSNSSQESLDTTQETSTISENQESNVTPDINNSEGNAIADNQVETPQSSTEVSPGGVQPSTEESQTTPTQQSVDESAGVETSVSQ